MKILDQFIGRTVRQPGKKKPLSTTTKKSNSPMALGCTIIRGGQLLRTSHFINSFRRTMAEYPVKSINFEDLKSKVQSKEITLIDVREPKELKEDGKIPNSINIPLGAIESAFKLTESPFQSKYGFSKPCETEGFVLSCRSGKRAAMAFNKIAPLGYQNALVYSGSFEDWVKNGGVVDKE